MNGLTAPKHVLCLFPYQKHISGMNFFPPTGLEYIAGSLRGRVPRVSLVDMSRDPGVRTPQSLMRFVEDEGVDLVCASLNWDYKADEAVDLLKGLPAGVRLVVGGQTATKDAEELFARLPNMSALVRGEGEETVREIAAGSDFRSVAGLSFRENGSVVHNPNRPLPPAADLPNPDRSLRRCTYRVAALDIPLLNGSFDAVLASRGCPFNCKFCTFSMNPLGQKRKYSSRPVESVLEELETIDARYVIFSDDYFFVEPDRTKAICDGIVARGLQRNYIVNARVEVAKRPDVLESARAAGVKILLLGIESATDRILRQLRKGFHTAQIRDYMAVIKSMGFFNHGYFIYGNLGETEEEMMRIPGFAREIGLDSITLSKLRAEKFSPIHGEVAATEGAWIGSTGFVYQKGLERRDLKRIGKAIRKDFYNPEQLARMLRKGLAMDLLGIPDVLRVAAMSPVLGLEYGRRLLRHWLRGRRNAKSEAISQP